MLALVGTRSSRCARLRRLCHVQCAAMRQFSGWCLPTPLSKACREASLSQHWMQKESNQGSKIRGARIATQASRRYMNAWSEEIVWPGSTAVVLGSMRLVAHHRGGSKPPPITNFWLQHRVPFGPPPRDSCHDYMPQFSWTEHLQWALARETHMSPKTLDPTLSWCIRHRHLFHSLEAFQNAVISDIQNLVSEMEEHTMAWFHTLPEHVQRAYRHKNSVTHTTSINRRGHHWWLSRTSSLIANP